MLLRLEMLGVTMLEAWVLRNFWVFSLYSYFYFFLRRASPDDGFF